MLLSQTSHGFAMNPTHRTSPARKGKRRSHHALKPQNVARCPNCQSPKQPHRACPQCGYVRPGLTVKTGGAE